MNKITVSIKGLSGLEEVLNKKKEDFFEAKAQEVSNLAKDLFEQNKSKLSNAQIKTEDKDGKVHVNNVELHPELVIER